MLSNDDILSKTILFLRFPLIVAVVFIHCSLTDVMINGTLLVSEGQFPIHDTLFHILTNELARIAVPLFFFISGFLFFYRSEFTLASYKTKLKKRVRTLLVPYVFWNMVVLLLTLLTQMFLSSMTSGRTKLVSEYGCFDWLDVFWSNGGIYPMCYQFWFIRDLMVVVLCSPLVYALVRYGKALAILALGVLWMFGWWFNVVGISITAFFFFSFGAWFSINHRNFVVDFKPLLWLCSALYLIVVLAHTCLWRYDISGFSFLHNVGIVLGLVAVVSWTALGIEKGRLHPSVFLAGSAFFVYAYHGMPIALPIKMWVKFFQPASELSMIAGYLLIPILMVCIGVGIYAVMKKPLPSFTALITGGR